MLDFDMGPTSPFFWCAIIVTETPSIRVRAHRKRTSDQRSRTPLIYWSHQAFRVLLWAPRTGAMATHPPPLSEEIIHSWNCDRFRQQTSPLSPHPFTQITRYLTAEALRFPALPRARFCCQQGSASFLRELHGCPFLIWAKRSNRDGFQLSFLLRVSFKSLQSEAQLQTLIPEGKRTNPYSSATVEELKICIYFIFWPFGTLIYFLLLARAISFYFRTSNFG